MQPNTHSAGAREPPRLKLSTCPDPFQQNPEHLNQCKSIILTCRRRRSEEGGIPTCACIVGNLATMPCSTQQKPKVTSRGEVTGERHSDSSSPNHSNSSSSNAHYQVAMLLRLRPIESGSDGNFIADSLAADLHLSSIRLQTPLLAKSLNG